MKHIYALLVVFLVFSCKNEQPSKALTAKDIVNKSIEVSGGHLFDSSSVVVIKFDFRDKSYKASHTPDGRVLSRFMLRDNDTILDFLKGNAFQRYINQVPVKVADSMIPRYSASVNSVHYFSVLPYGLNDKAVNKALIGEEQIKSKDYYKIKVTFNEEGGGEDFEDVFIYWVDKTTFKPDYLAYSYDEDDDKGMRFRVAYNERYVNGLRFVDYDNYKPKRDALPLVDIGNAFDTNNLELLSKIELENVEVELIIK
ncbi:DUF6503 family protein [Winogradskyella sp.]|uniref:DUF6503 family protein n=1 Tax=Winogradskyella sp. TaxID=1883156 RepID=UPI003BAC3C8E